MARRSQRSDLPPDRGALIDSLGACRRAMILGVQSKVRINGPVYVAANAVVAAIDALAALLTGDPQFFWNKAAPPKSTPTTGEGACGEASISSPQKVIHKFRGRWRCFELDRVIRKTSPHRMGSRVDWIALRPICVGHTPAVSFGRSSAATSTSSTSHDRPHVSSLRRGALPLAARAGR